MCRTESFGFEDEEAVSCGSNGGRRESNGRTRTKDPCLGKMALGEMDMMMIMTKMVMELVLMKSTLVTGKSVRGEKEREHYRCVMATPR